MARAGAALGCSILPTLIATELLVNETAFGIHQDAVARGPFAAVVFELRCRHLAEWTVKNVNSKCMDQKAKRHKLAANYWTVATTIILKDTNATTVFVSRVNTLRSCGRHQLCVRSLHKVMCHEQTSIDWHTLWRTRGAFERWSSLSVARVES